MKENILIMMIEQENIEALSNIISYAKEYLENEADSMGQILGDDFYKEELELIKNIQFTIGNYNK